MRITGGRWRSRRLRGPARSMRLRPTPDALRERAFAVLGGRLEGARFLDLYCGTGAVGLEALSRGADRAVLIDCHPAATAIAAANRAALGLDAGAAPILRRRARRALEELARRGERFDLAWADPPFERWREGLEVLGLAFEHGLLEAGATVCLECPAAADLAHLPAGMVLARDLAGGASRLAMMERPG